MISDVLRAAVCVTSFEFDIINVQMYFEQLFELADVDNSGFLEPEEDPNPNPNPK